MDIVSNVILHEMMKMQIAPETSSMHSSHSGYYAFIRVISILSSRFFAGSISIVNTHMPIENVFINAASA